MPQKISLEDIKKQYKYENRYKNPQRLDGIQTPPDQMTVTDFKQDYVVMIRKKLYYAINQNDNEEYLKIFQLNNFVSVRTSHSVYGRSNATVTLRGGEKVVVADKDLLRKHGWSSIDDVLLEWRDDDNATINHAGDDGVTWNGITYDSKIEDRLRRYGWAYAEKCDFEPMDEIYIYAKSRRKREKNNTYSPNQFHYEQIFFGYLSAVKKDFSAGQTGPTITIQAEDHLKLLQISRVANRPASDLNVQVGSSYYDAFGNLVLDDTALVSGIDVKRDEKTGKILSVTPSPAAIAVATSSIFAGKDASDIIIKLCIEAGIPNKYLEKRIETIKRIPFTIQMRDFSTSDLFTGDYGTRLSYCTKAAEILNLEFFADEEGNIVFKIPTFNVGINYLPGNNLGYGPGSEGAGDTPQPTDPNPYHWEEVKKTVKKTRQKTIKVDDQPVWYTIVKGDNLWNISKKFYGDPMKWKELYRVNNKRLKSGDPHWIFPGERIIIRKGPGEKVITETYNETVTEKVKVADLPKHILLPGLSYRTDQLIPVAWPNEIISFSFTHSDKELYTAAQVTAETPVINGLMTSVPESNTRAIQDTSMILKYGVRVFPPVTTPIVGGPTGAQIYAALLLMRSYASVYSGSLTMIEESTIKVGDPIRFHLYDENIFPENFDRNWDDIYNYNAEGKHEGMHNAQAVFYVDAIDRAIQPNQVSTMTLSLRAGREMGMSSIFDQCQELYRYYKYDESPPIAKEEEAGVKKAIQSTSTKTYKVKKGDSLWKIAVSFYGSGTQYKKIYDANRTEVGGPLTSPNRVYPGTVLKIP
jgi:nucleoid-associated protein YgaU